MFAITFECTTALQQNHIFGPILQLIAPVMNKKYSQLSRCHAKYVIFDKRPYLKKESKGSPLIDIPQRTNHTRP